MSTHPSTSLSQSTVPSPNAGGGPSPPVAARAEVRRRPVPGSVNHVGLAPSPLRPNSSTRADPITEPTYGFALR